MCRRKRRSIWFWHFFPTAFLFAFVVSKAENRLVEFEKERKATVYHPILLEAHETISNQEDDNVRMDEIRINEEQKIDVLFLVVKFSLEKEQDGERYSTYRMWGRDRQEKANDKGDYNKRGYRNCNIIHHGNPFKKDDGKDCSILVHFLQIWINEIFVKEKKYNNTRMNDDQYFENDKFEA